MSTKDQIRQGFELALRAAAAPLLLGHRWASGGGLSERKDAPSTPGGVSMVSKMALDEIFLATELVSASIISLAAQRRSTREISRALALYETRGWLANPAEYHVEPPVLEDPTLEDVSSWWGDHEHLCFESGYAPHPGEPGRQRWLGYEANRTAHAWVMRHPGPPRAWLVCIPGYRMGHHAVDFVGFGARWLHRALGLNVAIPVLPLHGPRREGRRGGDGFLTGDFIDTVHAQTQAVWDTRRLMSWIRSQEAPTLGAYGVSLGGYTTALLASVEDRLDCVIAGIPASCFMRLVRSHTPGFVLRLGETLGFSFEDIGQLMRVVSPLAIPPQVPHERRFLYAGVADRLVTPDHALDLWHHWERPRLAWYDGAHVSFLWETKAKDLIREALDATGITGGPCAEATASPKRPRSQGKQPPPRARRKGAPQRRSNRRSRVVPVPPPVPR